MTELLCLPVPFSAAITYNGIYTDAILFNQSAILLSQKESIVSRMIEKKRERFHLEAGNNNSKSFGSKQGEGILLTQLLSSNGKCLSVRGIPRIWPALVVLFFGAKISFIFHKN